MIFSRKKIKSCALSCLSLTLCATFATGTALANFDGSKRGTGNSASNSLSFTNVTGQFDTSHLNTQNFNSSVLEAPKTESENKTLIVALSGKSVLDAKSNNETVADFMDSSVGFATMRSIANEQKTFLNKLDSHKINYKIKQTYSTILNAVAIEVNTMYLSEIKSFAGVKSVSVANTYLAPQTVVADRDENGAVTNDSYVYNTGIYDSSDYSDPTKYPWGTGAGTVVAIIDTGLDYTHNAFRTPPKETSPEFSKSAITQKLADTTASKRISALGGLLSVEDVYISEKVPYAFDYADTDTDVYPSYSNHGTHVAGIVAGYDEDGYDKDDVHYDETFKGVAPDAQLVICKTFTDNLDDPALGGAESENIMAALEDCVTLGVDVINMSLGTTAGFTSSDDDDDEGRLYDAIFKNIQKEGISLICAASNDYSAGFGSVYGTNLASNPDSGTVGSPSSYYAALSVASVSGQKAEYLRDPKGNAIFFENSSDGNSEPYDFIDLMLDEDKNVTSREFEYVYAGTGQASSYNNTVRELVKGRIALIQRGGNTFQQKVEYAVRAGAIGVIIFNNVAGTVRMSLGTLSKDDFKPAISITKDAGDILRENARSGQSGIVGKITIERGLGAGPFMSAFSSWGTTPDLKIKPEITAHGGEIISTVPGGYDKQSGTSMASPNMAGVTALVRNYVKTLDIAKNMTASQITQLTNQLILSTATTAFDENGLAYSPRKQGSGLANLDNIVNTKAFLYTDEASDKLSKIGDKNINIYYDGKDGRPKIELGEDGEKKGVYTFAFNVKNFGNEPLIFTPESLCMTETISNDKIAVAEKAYMLDDNPAVFTVDGKTTSTVTVGKGESKTVTVTLTLSNDEKKYINNNFVNGMFVEGFIKLTSNSQSQCDLTLPFLSFFGDWQKAPMLDYDAYELAQMQQNSSLDDEQKPSETVWATQAYASYCGEKYVIPMGSYIYTQDPDPSQIEIYANMEYNAISRFNDITNDEGIGDYLTTYNIRCVYAGLLRNASVVNYKLYDTATGELITEGHKNRISKAYANGGSSRPAYIELKFTPDELGLIANGKYRFDFEFLFDKDSEPTAENTFSFDFYVDYESPVLQDARLRYYNYKDGTKDKQRIYLDLDVYDNHYPECVMLCYRDESDGEIKLNLATDYATPVRNAVKNGVSTVSIEVTDIWEEYKDILYVQINDYALNHSNYYLGSFNGGMNVSTALNVNVLPDKFDLAPGEDNITIDINQAHKIKLVYDGSADISNFILSVGSGGKTENEYFAVKNGEIVGLASTNGRARPVTVSNGKGESKVISVTVTDKVATVNNPDFSFNVIRNSNEALVKAKNNGSTTVYAGEDIELKVVPDPWYYPMDNVSVVWSTKDSAVTVSATGKVHTVSKGSATVTALITLPSGQEFTRNFTFVVQDEFAIDNMVLTAYHGEGVNGVVTFPENSTVMSIGEESFKGNTKITKIVIPKTVTQIDPRAFKGCTALKEVYFVADNELPIAESTLKLIDRNAFEGCISLETLDLRNVKIISVAREAFKDCIRLNKILKSEAIGTAYDRAFIGCEALESIDISGLHVAGANVFSGCINLRTVTTDRFTAIGDGMFSNCLYKYSVYDYSAAEWVTQEPKDYKACNKIESLIIQATSVGNGAFENCTGLQRVTFKANENYSNLEFTIGNRAFANCTNLGTVTFGDCVVRSIGSEAFKDTRITLANITLPEGLQTIGFGAFGGTNLTDGANGGYTIKDKAIFSGGTLLLYTGNGNYTVPETVNGFTVTKIADYAFANSGVTRVTVPSNIVEIGEGAFANSTLATVTFEGNINTIPDYAFYNSKLTSVSLPNSVTYVGNYAFAKTPISTFNFTPDNKAEFGDCVFSGCFELSEIELNAKITKMGSATFENCSALHTVKLPALESLGAYTFLKTPALSTVTFGSGSTVTGTYTFYASRASDRQYLTSVIFNGCSFEEIGEGLFVNCVALTTIDLRGAKVVQSFAFAGCGALETVTGLSSVTVFENYAFADCASLGTLNLTSAKAVGDYAFFVSGSKTYSSVSIPNAVSVGKFAFYGGGESTVEIPASLVVIGSGAFAGSSQLTNFTVATGNKAFFVNDGVLYGYAKNYATQLTEEVLNPDNTITLKPLYEYDLSVRDNEYILVAYPSAKTGSLVDGQRTYTVLDSTIKVEGSAFRDLNSGSLAKVVLPYELKVVGASAFYNSGITTYEFKGVVAPVLETEYSAAIEYVVDESRLTSAQGYFYTNFEGEFIFYAGMAEGVTPTKLTIYRPDNGSGYDNYIFSNYFGNCVLTGITKSQATDAFIKFVAGSPSASEISKWNKQNKDAKEVEAFAAEVKTAHENLNEFSSDEVQMAFVPDSYVEQFTAIENALRPIKSQFGIKVSISRLTYTGSYKSEYKVGEKFNMKGLQIIVVYDDYSTENADMSKVELLTTEPLTEYHNTVKLSYGGKTVSVAVNVTEKGSSDGNGGGCGGCGSTTTLGGPIILTLSAIGLMIFVSSVLRRRKQR